LKTYKRPSAWDILILKSITNSVCDRDIENELLRKRAVGHIANMVMTSLTDEGVAGDQSASGQLQLQHCSARNHTTAREVLQDA